MLAGLGAVDVHQTAGERRLLAGLVQPLPPDITDHGRVPSHALQRRPALPQHPLHRREFAPAPPPGRRIDRARVRPTKISRQHRPRRPGRERRHGAHIEQRDIHRRIDTLGPHTLIHPPAEATAEHEMMRICCADRGRRTREIPPRKFPRPLCIVPPIAARRDRLLHPGPLPHDLLIPHRHTPRPGEGIDPSAVQRQDKFPRRMISRKVRLEAQTTLQQTRPRPTTRRRRSPPRQIICHPTDQSPVHHRRRTDLKGPGRRPRRPFRSKHVGQPHPGRLDHAAHATKIYTRDKCEAVCLRRAVAAHSERIETPLSQARRGVFIRRIGTRARRAPAHRLVHGHGRRPYAMHPAAKKRPTLRIEQPPPSRLILPHAKKTLRTAQGADTKFFGRNWGGVGSGCVGMRHGPRSVQISPKKESAQCILNAQCFLRGQHPHAFDHPLATRESLANFLHGREGR